MSIFYKLKSKKFNLLAGGLNPAITGPGKITGLSDRSRNSFDYEMRSFQGALLAPCDVYYCGNYVVKSPLSRMLDVVGLKIEAVINGKEIDWREPPKIIEEVVEKKKWISEKSFLHALNFTMILPGPEAQQLATYIGWLMHGRIGGLIAGTLFIALQILSNAFFLIFSTNCIAFSIFSRNFSGKF